MAEDFGGVSFLFKYQNFEDEIAKLHNMENQVDDAIGEAATYFVMTGLLEIKSRASGRPGPNVISNNLRGGYQGDIIERSHLYAKVHIWNETEYARYVEFMNGGQYSHYRPGIQATITKTETFYKNKLQDIAK